MDEQVQSAIARGLKHRGVDVLTIQDDRRLGLPDPEILDRATQLGRPLFTRDEDFLSEAAYRQREGLSFAGVIYVHRDRVSIGDCVRDLELLAGVLDPAEVANRVLYLPIR